MSTNASPLTAEQLAELRTELTRELERLERSLRSTAEGARPVQADQTTMGRLSRMDALQSQQLASDLLGREQTRRAQIVDALERMDRGTYGMCTACGQPIAYGRLLVVPEARTCAACGARAR